MTRTLKFKILKNFKKRFAKLIAEEDSKDKKIKLILKLYAQLYRSSENEIERSDVGERRIEKCKVEER